MDWNQIALRDAIFGTSALVSVFLQQRLGARSWALSLALYTITACTIDLLWPSLMHALGATR